MTEFEKWYEGGGCTKFGPDIHLFGLRPVRRWNYSAGGLFGSMAVQSHGGVADWIRRYPG